MREGQRMEIILARHGRPKLEQRGWIAPRQLAGWVRAYDEGGILVGGAPLEVRAKAGNSGIIVSSPLLRCVESARAVASQRNFETDELLREAGLPYALWGFPRLPLWLWTLVFRGAWFCGYSANSESLDCARMRAQSAAHKLIALASVHKSVFVMGHGIMAALIAKELVQLGWVGPRRPAHGYWGSSVYRRESCWDSLTICGGTAA
jgi:broad specificity phosphatase PhoE